MVTNSIINSTEDKIKIYYRNLEEIERLEYKLTLLQKQKTDIEFDINNSNIDLDYEIKAVNYDRVNVQTSNTTSPQEKSIDIAFKQLEKQLELVNKEILETKILIRDLQKKSSDIGFIINKLNNEAKDFIKMHYKLRKNYREISFLLHISTASVVRLRKNILYDVSKWICFYF